MNRFAQLLAAVLALAAHGLAATEFYVSTAGNDANPGNKTQPFATLERARDEIRKLKLAGPLAVGISGNDHVFEYNILRDVCTASDDAAALYKGRNPSCRGNVIRYNFWRDIGSPMGHGAAAVHAMPI